jgi:hypothetical protein
VGCMARPALRSRRIDQLYLGKVLEKVRSFGRVTSAFSASQMKVSLGTDAGAGQLGTGPLFFSGRLPHIGFLPFCPIDRRPADDG